MKCSVSRTRQEAVKDEEWPGRDVRKWRQSRIVWTTTGLCVETVAADAPAAAAMEPAATPADLASAAADAADADEPSHAPLSPSLRRESRVV
jgi:hypothetical protein